MKKETENSIASVGEWKEFKGSAQDKKGVTSKKLGWLGIGLCGLACSLPFLGAIIGISFFSAIAVYLETFAILVLGLAGVFFAFAYYQKKKKASNKTGGASCEVDISCGCGSESGPEKNEKAGNSVSMKEPNINACDVSGIGVEERERIIRNSKELFQSVQEIKELPDGYALGFEGSSPEMITRLAEFISFDRQCCPFLLHELAIEPNNGLTWIRMRGGEGSKAQIKAELSYLLPTEKAIA